MAYLVNIAHVCGKDGCSARATVQLYNLSNAPAGCYCKRHGDAALREMKQREDDWWKAQREA
jgi:hypothetical protein